MQVYLLCEFITRKRDESILQPDGSWSVPNIIEHVPPHRFVHPIRDICNVL